MPPQLWAGIFVVHMQVTCHVSISQQLAGAVGIHIAALRLPFNSPNHNDAT
jgi:hypothetical protein